MLSEQIMRIFNELNLAGATYSVVEAAGRASKGGEDPAKTSQHFNSVESLLSYPFPQIAIFFFHCFTFLQWSNIYSHLYNDLLTSQERAKEREREQRGEKAQE